MKTNTIEILDLVNTTGKIECNVVRYSVGNGTMPINLSWNDTSKRPGFISLGNDIAFVKASRNDIEHHSVSAEPDRLGNNEFSWRDTAHQGNMIIIVVLPTEYIIRDLKDVSPTATRFKVFDNRLAFYWDIGQSTTDLRWKITLKGNRNLENLCADLNRSAMDSQGGGNSGVSSSEQGIPQGYQPAAWEKITVAGLAVIIVIAVLYASLQSNEIPARNFALLRILLSSAMGVIGGVIPGFLHVDMSSKGTIIRAGGGLALGIITFFFTPHIVPNDRSDSPVGSVTPTSSSANFDTPVAAVVPPVPIDRMIFGYEAKDLDYSEFSILEDHRVLDLRRLNDVPASKETTRHSPACWYRRIKLKKTADADVFVARYGTSGAGVDAVCLTHDYKVGYMGFRSNTKADLLMKNFDILVDVAREPVGEPFEIAIEATMWNGFTQPEEWAGFDAYEEKGVELKSMKILFPTAKPFTNLWYRVTVEDTDDVKTLPTNFREHRDKSNRGVSWVIEKPDPKEWIETKWTW